MSQIEGSRVHKIDDFVDLSNRFIMCAIYSDIDNCIFNIRLRRKSELDLLDVSLLQQARIRPNIVFSLMEDGDLYKTRCDLIVSATSTGMMYAQYMQVPCLQLVSERLLAHWPYLFAREANRLLVDDLENTLAPAIKRLLNASTDMLFYDTLPVEEQYSRLDDVYEDTRAKVQTHSKE